MKEIITPEEQALLQTRPHGAKWYALVHEPRIVAELDIIPLWGDSVGWHRTVTSAVEYDDVKRNMTAIISNSTTGSELGRVRIRKDYTWSGTEDFIDIAETGCGLINWREADKMTVLDKYDPWTIHPYFNKENGLWHVDLDIIVADKFNSQVVANPGAPIILLPDEPGGSTWTTKLYHYSRSVGHNDLFGDGYITSETWYLPDGRVIIPPELTVQGDPSHGDKEPLEVTFTGASPGGSYIHLHVTDSGNGHHTAHRLIFALNDLSEAANISVADISGGIEQGGYTANFTLNNANLNGNNIDHNEIVVFEIANYGSDVALIGVNDNLTNDRAIFRGWVSQYQITRGLYHNTATVTAETIHGIMSRSDSYDAYYKSIASEIAAAKDFTGIPNMTLDKIAMAMGQWRSTVFDICDFRPSQELGGIGNTEVPFYQDLSRSSWFAQMRTNYHEKGYLGYFAADMQSNLWAGQDAIISGNSDIPTVYNITSHDWGDGIQAQRMTVDMNSHVQLYAVTSDIPLGAESPAEAIGYFGTYTSYEKGLLVGTQETLTKWTGNYRAKLNSDMPMIQIPMAGNYKFDAVPQHQIELNTGDSELPVELQNLELENKKLVQKELTVTYDANAAYPKVMLIGEQWVSGFDGSPIEFPAPASLVTLPPVPEHNYSPPPVSQVPPPTQGELPTGQGTVYLQIRRDLWRTRDFSATEPSWVSIPPEQNRDDWHDFILDPWRPETTGYMIGGWGDVFKATDLDTAGDGQPTWTKIRTESDFINAHPNGLAMSHRSKCTYAIHASINYDGFVAIWVADSQDRVCVIVTTDGFETDYRVIRTSLSANWRARYKGGGYIVPHLVNGKIVLYAYMDGYLWRADSGDGFLTYTSSKSATRVPSSHTNLNGAQVHCPYAGNEDGNKVWVANIGRSYASHDGVCETYKVNNINGDVTNCAWERISATHNGEVYDHIGIRKYGYEVSSLNYQYHYFWAGERTSGDNKEGLFVSNDAGNSWNFISHPPDYPDSVIVACGGFPFNEQQFYIVTRGKAPDGGNAYLSLDGGHTWANKTTASNVFINIDSYANECSIHPLWTE